MDNYFVSNVLDRNMKGWLPVIDKAKNSFVVPYSMKLKRLDQKNFEIVEGVNKSRVVSVDYSKVKPRLFFEYLKPYFSIHDGLHITVNKQGGYLKVDKDYGIGREVKCDEVETGEYQILVPDRQHSERMSNEYFEEISGGSRFCDTWFPIVKEGSINQYLHFGSYSEGCITVTDKWQELYFELITSRKSDSVIGTVQVE